MTENNPFADAEPAEAFAITTIERLTWYLRKVGNLEAERDRVKAQAAQMLAQIDGELKSLTDRFGVEAELFTAEELVRQGGKRKSLVTLQGTCSFRTVPAHVKIADENEALIYALKNPNAFEYVPIKQTVNATIYRATAEKALRETGELLPGLERVESRQSFSVSFKGEKTIEESMSE